MSIKGFKINGNVEKVDYNALENAPCYSEYVPMTKVIETKEYEFVDANDDGTIAGLEFELTSLQPVIAGTPYNFTLGDTTEQITFAANMEGEYPMLLAGNLSIIEAGDDTGEKYLIYVYGDPDESLYTMAICTTEPAGTYTVGLSYVGDTVPLIPSGKYTFDTTAYSWPALGLNPKETDKYNFTFDENVYENVFFKTFIEEGHPIYYMGNLSFANEGAEDTGETYLLYLANIGVACLCKESGEHAISLEIVDPMVETVYKLDNKYLDIDLPYTVDDDNGDIDIDRDLYFSVKDDGYSIGLRTMYSLLKSVEFKLATMRPCYDMDGTEDTRFIILRSSTLGSQKLFKITVDDSGTLSATEFDGTYNSGMYDKLIEMYNGKYNPNTYNFF